MADCAPLCAQLLISSPKQLLCPSEYGQQNMDMEARDATVKCVSVGALMLGLQQP